MQNVQHVCIKLISPTEMNQFVIVTKQMMTAKQGLFKSSKSDFPLTESRILRIEK